MGKQAEVASRTFAPCKLPIPPPPGPLPKRPNPLSPTCNSPISAFLPPSWLGYPN